MMVPDISVIIPVLHEKEIINGRLDEIRSLSGGRRVEIIVVDGAPESDTIRTIIRKDIVKTHSGIGRGKQLNRGASISNGEVLLFLHADTSLPTNAFEVIMDTMCDEGIHGGAFKIGFDSIPPVIRALLPIQNLRSKITRVPYGDQGIFLRKKTFHMIGGFADIKLFEDIDLMTRMRKRGYSIRILKDHVITSGRRFSRGGPLRTLVKNMILILLFHLGKDPDKLHESYYRERRPQDL